MSMQANEFSAGPEGEPVFNRGIAAAMAEEAHKEQVDKGDGSPYIRHCRRVMKAVEPYGEAAQIVGILHDSIEDTWVTPEYLRERGAPAEIIEGILSVTKREGEPYDELIKRAKVHPLGKLVKLADNLDNSNEARLALFPDEQAARFRAKYTGARALLLEDDGWLADQLPLLKERIEALYAAGE